MAHTHPDDQTTTESLRLWDAGVAFGDVCCAAYQLGACPHTEGDADDYPAIAAMNAALDAADALEAADAAAFAALDPADQAALTAARARASWTVAADTAVANVNASTSAAASLAAAARARPDDDDEPF